jgi:hypothetical protein
MDTLEEGPNRDDGSIVITDKAQTARQLTIGGVQMLLSMVFGAITAIAAWALITKRVANADGPGSLVMLAVCAPPFVILLALASRNFQRLHLHASVTANRSGIRLRIPVVPFLLAPYQVLREEFVPWQEASLTFTPAKGSRLLVSRARPEAAIPPGHFLASLYEIDDGLRGAVESLGQAGARVEPQHVFTGTSPAALLIAGFSCVSLFAVLMVWLMDSVPALGAWLGIGSVLGIGLIGMGLAPRKRVVIDQRGLFMERGHRLDFIPRELFPASRIEHSSSLFGAFQSGQVHATVDGSKFTVGFNRVIGLGLPVNEIRAALGGN